MSKKEESDVGICLKIGGPVILLGIVLLMAGGITRLTAGEDPGRGRTTSHWMLAIGGGAFVLGLIILGFCQLVQSRAKKDQSPK